MTNNKIKVFGLVIGILFLCSLIATVYYYNEKQVVQQDFEEIKSEKETLLSDFDQLEKKYTALKNNTHEIVIKAAEDFTNAFFAYDTAKAETFISNIEPYVTKKAKEQLTPLGYEKPTQPTAPELSVKSAIQKQIMYFSPVEDNKANVVARVWRDLTSNKITTTTVVMMDLQLIYENDKWIVDEAKQLFELNE
jgi:hypothetical protein